MSLVNRKEVFLDDTRDVNSTPGLSIGGREKEEIGSESSRTVTLQVKSV